MKRMFILVCALALAAGSGCSPRVEKKEVALAGAQSGGRLPERVRQFDGGEGFYLSGLKAERSDGKVSLQFGMRDLGQAPKAYEVVAVLVLPELTIYNYFGAGTHLLIFFPPASGGNNAAFSLDGFKRSGGRSRRLSSCTRPCSSTPAMRRGNSMSSAWTRTSSASRCATRGSRPSPTCCRPTSENRWKRPKPVSLRPGGPDTLNQ